MSVLNVLRYPDPLLKKVCKEVTKFDNELQTFVANFTETMYHYKFCVGLASSQVGRLDRLITIDVSKAKRPQPGHGLLVLINPELIHTSDFKIVREGCLSIPDFTANVKRAMKIKLRYQDTNGESKELEAENFEAHAIQHEMDHLDGILFLDKITNPAADLFRRVKH